MAIEYFTTDISELCTPLASSDKDTKEQPNIWPLSQRGNGYTGVEAVVLRCLVDKQTGESGEYKGDHLYALATTIQYEPRVAKSARNIEFRATQNIEGQVGLLYRKLPISGGKRNSWIDSAGVAVSASVGRWGAYIADHAAEAYRFEPMLNPPESVELPTPNYLINSLLAKDYIDSLAHPVVQKLLGYGVSKSATPLDQEDDSSAY